MLKNFAFICFILFCAITNLNAQCTDNGNYWNESWVSCQTSANPNPVWGNTHWILYEFDEVQYIGESHVWNANRVGESGWGAKDVIIDYSTDGTTWINLGTYLFSQADESATYAGFTGPNFGGVAIQKILLTIQTTHSGSGCASLAEMQFKIDPDACYGVVDICGVCDGAGEIEWFIDVDGDGLGSETSSIIDCTQPAGYVTNKDDICDNGALGWNDISTLFVNSGCTGCHGGAGGLQLDSYVGISNGGNYCGPNVLTGNNLVNIITTTNFNACGTTVFGPAMNDRASQPLTTAELEKIQAWIDGGAPEDCRDYCTTGNCLPGLASINLRVFLEGAYLDGTQTMRTDLASSNLIPLQQPYNVAPYNYTGSETLSSVPSRMVDWVLVELRSDVDPIYKLSVQAGILMEDGYIKATDGVSDLKFNFPNGGDYYLVVRHRNHLDIMTALPTNNSNNLTHDFSMQVTQAYGTSQQKAMPDGVAVMFAGDINTDLSIQVTDYDVWKSNPAELNVYTYLDLNLDGVSQITDYDLWFLNKAKLSPTELGY